MWSDEPFEVYKYVGKTTLTRCDNHPGGHHKLTSGTSLVFAWLQSFELNIVLFEQARWNRGLVELADSVFDLLVKLFRCRGDGVDWCKGDVHDAQTERALSLLTVESSTIRQHFEIKVS